MTDPMRHAAERASEASRELSALSTSRKNAVLESLADRIEQDTDAIVSANAEDLTQARAAHLSDAKLKRLALDRESIALISEGLRQVARLEDPIGVVTKSYTTAGGLEVRKVRSPLGVILMIYEARPSVTVDAFALCFKAGNACILKGGREARRSNTLLAGLAQEALRDYDVTPDAVTLITTSERAEIERLLAQDALIDLVIPRGGRELIEFVCTHSRIPTVQHFHGVCHIYVDAEVDLESAQRICLTAKTSAPATCNAVETILVHQDVAAAFIPELVKAYVAAGVEVRGDARTCSLHDHVKPATENDWGREFLDLIVAIKVVENEDGAIRHIHTHGSNHTEAILTTNEERAQAFVDRVQASCVLVNASTRFNDGFQLDLGAEIGISTSRIHAYGPMGLEELTTQRYVVRGCGHAR